MVEAALGINPELLINMQTRYNMSVARQKKPLLARLIDIKSRLAGTVLLDYFSPKSCGGHKGFHFFITPVSGTLYHVCWILLYTSVPPFEEVILPNEVVQVEGFLHAQADGLMDGTVAVAFGKRILYRCIAEKAALVPDVHIYGNIGHGLLVRLVHFVEAILAFNESQLAGIGAVEPGLIYRVMLHEDVYLLCLDIL
jgi:hypothetical protein